jgi:hypothetical protein
MTNTHRARRKDHTVDVDLQQQAPLPPPSASTASATPIMPQAASNARPHVAGATPAAYVAPPAERRGRSRTRVYTISAVVFLVISIAGYIGFRSYIYGDDAPPVPVLDDLGG